MESKILAEGLGIITEIEELEGYQLRPSMSPTAAFWRSEGFRVRTDQHELLVLIDDSQWCCESWGYIHSTDDLQEFIGAELSTIRLTDTALNATIIDRHGQGEYGFDGGGIQFIDLDTSKGKLQLAVYNAHNGYYGHGIVVALDELPLAEDTL